MYCASACSGGANPAPLLGAIFALAIAIARTKKCATSSRAFYNILQARAKGNIPLCVCACTWSSCVSTREFSADGKRTTCPVDVARSSIPSASRCSRTFVREKKRIFQHKLIGRSMTFPNKQNVKSIIRRIPSARTLECSFPRNGRNDARSTNDDDALVDSRATHVTDPGRASSRSLNRATRAYTKFGTRRRPRVRAHGGPTRSWRTRRLKLSF